MKIRKSALLLLALLPIMAGAQKTVKVVSPNGKTEATISVGDDITYTVSVDGRQVMNPSKAAMRLTDGTTWGHKASIASTKRSTVDQMVASPFYRSTAIREHYNAAKMTFKGGWTLEFRAYDDGVAYRFSTTSKRPFNVENETVSLNFPTDAVATVPFVHTGTDGDIESQFGNSFENNYTVARLSELNKRRLMFLPLVVDAGEGVKLCVTESDLQNYPGMFMSSACGGNALEGVFAPYPKTTEQGGHNNLQMIVKQREPFIAKVAGARTFPWRIIMVSRHDKELAANNLSYLLGAPSKVQDTSWIRPGKVAWDWWNDWNISGVDFKTGVNTNTYKAYIDFAHDNGIEYVILDEGWSVTGAADLMQVVPEIDLEEILSYAQKQGVSIILWAGYHAFDRDMEQVCRHYSAMGVKGFKVDFMDRDDQEVTAFEHRAAAMCAKYHLLLDMHGSYKPAGMNRTYPNVLNFEGVNGLEQMKWSPDTLDQVLYDVQIPFIRQAAGPMDYTQGAMRNAQRGAYYPCNSEPMSQGTRCRQLALYMIFDSPLTMLCDAPSNYRKEQECTDFIAKVPTAWDETVVIDGRIGVYVVVARRKGDKWYIGGITNREARDVSFDMIYAKNKKATATLFKDGANAERKGSDYKKETLAIEKGSRFTVHLASGGGFAMVIE